MQFLTYLDDGAEKIGVLTKAQSQILPLEGIFEAKVTASMLDFIKYSDDQSIDKLKDLIEGEAYDKDTLIPLEKVEVCAPIPRLQGDVICLGFNYRAHVEESLVIGVKQEIPKHPVYFGKKAALVTGPKGEIYSHSEVTEELDYEVELAIVIGKEGTNIVKEEAEEYIFGYTILNDVSARNLQRQHGQWLRGKSLDTFTVMGPHIVHKSEIPFPVELDLISKVNGELRQNSNTRHLIFDIPYIISDLSKGMTLRPGDVIATGTPAGVGMGFEPPRYLKAGDVVECIIEKLGSIVNRIK